MKVKGLDIRKLVAAIVLCVVAIGLAVAVIHKTNEPVKLPDMKSFRAYGPGGAPANAAAGTVPGRNQARGPVNVN